jgi:hypothetical protein
MATHGTLRDQEAALILQTVRAVGGMIGGPHGAAARLGLKRTTLLSKMKRLGIFEPRHQRLINDGDEQRESERSVNKKDDDLSFLESDDVLESLP